MNWKLGPVLALLLMAGESFAQEVPEELENLQRLFRSKMNKEVGPVKAIYLRELASLERKLLATGRKEEASLVNAEKQAWQSGKVIDMKIIRPKPPKINLPLKEFLPYTLWAYQKETNGSVTSNGQLIFLEDGKMNLAVGSGGLGTFKILDENRVAFSVKSYPVAIITFSPDRKSFSSKDEVSSRAGKLLAISVVR